MKKKIKNQEEYLEQLEKQRKSIDTATAVDISKEENNDSQEKKPQEKKKRSKYPIYIAVILIATALTMWISLKDDFSLIVQNFQTMNVPYFIYGSLCFIGCFLINSLILFLFARRYRKKYYFHQGMANDCIGNFYNCITPSASGGQFMQAYTYKKQGIPLSNGTSCLVMNFIVYQGVMILFATISVICESQKLFTTDNYSLQIGSVSLPFWVVMVLGYALQFIVIGLVILMSTWRGFHNFILNKGINFFAKLRLIKNPDETRRSLSVTIESFKIELKNLLVNPRFLVLIIILHIACFVCRYSIPFFINQAVLGNFSQASFAYNYSWWETFCFTSIHKMATELIPIPGSAGVSEAFYYAVFRASYVPTGELVLSDEQLINSQIRAYTVTAQILWRVITFYVPLLVTGLVTAFYKGKPSKEERTEASNGLKTYLTLNINTFDERKRTYQTIYTTKQINKKEFEKWNKNKSKNEDKK